MGNVKLNPAIKLWGGLGLLLIALAWSLFVQFLDYREDVEACQARDGVWVGGMPVRAGSFRFLKGRCEARLQEESF